MTEQLDLVEGAVPEGTGDTSDFALAVDRLLSETSVDPTYLLKQVKVLLWACLQPPGQQGQQQQGPTGDAEEAGTFLWDFSASRVAPRVLLACGFVAALPAALAAAGDRGEDGGRLCELLLGIAANLASSTHGPTQELLASGGMPEQLVGQCLLGSSHTGALAELCRLLTALLASEQHGAVVRVFSCRGGGELGWHPLDRLVECFVNTLDATLSERSVELMELLAERDADIAGHLAQDTSLVSELSAQLGRARDAEGDGPPEASPRGSPGSAPAAEAEPGLTPSTSGTVSVLCLAQELVMQGGLAGPELQPLLDAAQQLLLLGPCPHAVKCAAVCLLAVYQPEPWANDCGSAVRYPELNVLTRGSGRAFAALADLVQACASKPNEGREEEAAWVLIGRLGRQAFPEHSVLQALLSQPSSSSSAAEFAQQLLLHKSGAHLRDYQPEVGS